MVASLQIAGMKYLLRETIWNIVTGYHQSFFRIKYLYGHCKPSNEVSFVLILHYKFKQLDYLRGVVKLTRNKADVLWVAL